MKDQNKNEKVVFNELKNRRVNFILCDLDVIVLRSDSNGVLYDPSDKTCGKHW